MAMMNELMQHETELPLQPQGPLCALEELVPTLAHFREVCGALHRKLAKAENYPVTDEMPAYQLLEDIDQNTVQERYYGYLVEGGTADAVTYLMEGVKARYYLHVIENLVLEEDGRTRMVRMRGTARYRNAQVPVDLERRDKLNALIEELFAELREMGLPNTAPVYELRQGEIWRDVLRHPHPLMKYTGHMLRSVQERLAQRKLHLVEW